MSLVVFCEPCLMLAGLDVLMGFLLHSRTITKCILLNYSKSHLPGEDQLNLAISFTFSFAADLIHCTNEMNVNIPQLADSLFERTTNTSWVVVFKSLITTHHLMVYGNEVRRFSTHQHII